MSNTPVDNRVALFAFQTRDILQIWPVVTIDVRGSRSLCRRWPLCARVIVDAGDRETRDH